MEFTKQSKDEVELKGPEGKYDTRKLNSYPSKVTVCVCGALPARDGHVFLCSGPHPPPFVDFQKLCPCHVYPARGSRFGNHRWAMVAGKNASRTRASYIRPTMRCIRNVYADQAEAVRVSSSRGHVPVYAPPSTTVHGSPGTTLREPPILRRSPPPAPHARTSTTTTQHTTTIPSTTANTGVHALAPASAHGNTFVRIPNSTPTAATPASAACHAPTSLPYLFDAPDVRRT